MAIKSIPNKVKRRAQPQRSTQIDWSNPVTKGLQTSLELSAKTVVDSARRLAPISHALPEAISSKGKSLLFAGVTGINSGLTSWGGQNLFATATNPFTVSVWFRQTGTAAGTIVSRCSVNSSTKTFQVFQNAYGGFPVDSPSIFIRGAQTSPGWGFHDGNWHLVTVTFDGTNAIAYGDSGFSAAITVGTAAEETSETICIGSRTGNTGNFLNGNIQFVRVWNRALSRAEHLAIYENPYQLFKPAVSQVLLVPFAVSSYILEAATGTYASTGNSATTLVNRSLSLQNISFSITGFDSSLIKTSGSTTELGTYSIVGSNASLSTARNLFALSGTYALTGSLLSLGRQVILAGSPGSYNINLPVESKTYVLKWYTGTAWQILLNA